MASAPSTPILPESTAPPSSTGLATPDTGAPTSHLFDLQRRASPGLARSPANLALAPTAHAALKSSPLASNISFKLTPQPQPLTGAAALADERWLKEEMAIREGRATSPNPAVTALSSLMGVGSAGLSRGSDAPAAAPRMSDSTSTTAKGTDAPDPWPSENTQSSPVSLSNFGNVEATTAATASANTITTSRLRSGQPQGSGNEAPAHRSFTLPGHSVSEQESHGSSRGMSLPTSGYGQNSPRSSPTAKKHRCPYCSADFTRHHNLKSHLLTHSQEKPYVCETCNARFRRLHDLKRHTKLHTGERPHVCDKCGRRFARGDALARHNKGQGGCAGRRGSGGEEDYDDAGDPGDESMEGVIYEEPREEELDPKNEQLVDRARRVSEPNSKRHKASVDSRNELMPAPYRQHSTTYPPLGPNSFMGHANRGLQPPSTVYGGFSASASPRSLSGNLSPKGPGSSVSSINFTPGAPSISMYAQGGMTESPKPLSPGQVETLRLGAQEGPTPRGRSPSLTQQFQQQQFGRMMGRGSPPVGSLPQPTATSNGPLPSMNVFAPTSSDQRYAIPTPNMQQPSGKGSVSSLPPPPPPPGAQIAPTLHSQLSYGANAGMASSSGGSASSHGQSLSSVGSIREPFASLPEPGGDIWAYAKNLENMFRRVQEDAKTQEREYEGQVARLQEEVYALRGQLASQGR